MAGVNANESLMETRAVATAARVGHPQERWDSLIERVQGEAIRNFSDVAEEFLALMWCLDQFRIADIPPLGMGNLKADPQSRIDGIYRGKGNWFSTLLGLLLDNRTGQKIRSRSKIKGYSQMHQIDLAWPDRDIAPIVCAESKVTGGPAYRNYPARGAMNDWTNRRKELKFAATDLKLSRREQTMKIGHWAVWRAKAAPMTFMLWGARLSGRDTVEAMVRETEVLLATYLDGAGVFAWCANEEGSGYQPVALPDGSAVEDLDTALWRIESEIAEATAAGALTSDFEPSAPIDPNLLLDEG